ncbi:MAG: hypothetical protein WEB53_04275 [Akkermansiaceae bacterium]|jgi:hypothetical protein
MKSIITQLSTCALAMVALITTASETQAADVRLDGYGSYSLSKTVKYYGSGGPSQSGRYRKLGSDYYKSATIRMDFLTNRSTSKSGDLSFELWAMPYYGATSGIILMTEALSPQAGDSSRSNVAKEGKAISLDARRFPEFNLFEYTRKGWKSRDYLSFSRKVLF